MKKKFTMLLAMLLCCVGVAKADFTQTYTKTGEFWTAAGTEYPAGLNNTTDAGGGKGNASEHVGVDGHSVYKAEMNITANGGDITVTFAYVANQGLGTNSHAASFLGVDLLKDGNVVYQDYHLSFVGGTPQSNVYTLTGVESGDYTLRYFICDKAGDHAIIATGGTITVTGAELPIVASTAENKIFYHIKNVRSGKYANYEGANVQFTQVATPAIGSYWYLMEVAEAQDVPEGYKAYRLYNAGNTLAVENPSNGNMSANEGVTYPAKVYCIGNHTNGGYTGVVIRSLKEDGSSWNDAGGSGTAVANWSYDDPGSIWEFEKVNITESQLIQNAVAVKTSVVNTLTTEVANTQRYFYGYELSDLEAKKAEVEAIAVPENSLADAVTGAITISKMSLFAGLERVAPKAGDKFTMDNNERDGRLTAFAAGTDVKCLTESSPFAYYDALWTLVPTDTEGQFKLYNEKMNVYVGVLANADNTKFQYVSVKDEAGVYELENVDGYATFKKVNGGDKDYMHLSNWDGKELVRWKKQAGASQWRLAKAFGPELTTDADTPICYALKSGRDGNYYFTLDANKVKLYNNKTIATDETTHWYFMLDEGGNLKMYSMSDGKAMGYRTGTDANTRLTNDENDAEYDNNTYILYFAPYNKNNYNDAWFALKPSRGDTYVSNHGGTGNYMGFYNSFDDAGTRIAFESVDGLKLEAKIAECEAKVVKEAIGYYSVSGGDAAAVLAAAKEALQSNSNAAYRSSLAALEALTYTLNIPEVGKYYRIKGKTSGNYIDAAGQNNAQMNMKATPDPLGSIFLLDEGNRLKNMSTGTYVHNTHSIGATKENANTWEFISSSIGYLKLKANSGSVWLHDSGDKANRCSSDGADHEFIVEEVTLEELNGIYLEDCTYITALDYTENSNNPVIVNNVRSNWAIADNPTALNTLAKLGLAKAVFDTKQQFAFITPDGGKNYYLYSVHAKRYLKSNNTFGAQGEPILFNDASSQGENKVQVRFKGVEKYINVGGSKQMVIDDWGTIDVGNACEMVQCNTLTFNLDEALEIFNNGADITLTYKLGDKLVSTTTYETQGETFSFNNPYAFTTVTSCKKDGEDLEATEGTYSFEVAGDAHIVVELQDGLPFRYAAYYEEIEHWYFMKIRDDGFTYMGYDAEKSYIRANQSNVPVASKDASTWGFVGNPFDGFSIVNYATGKTKVLSAPVAPTTEKNADQLARMIEVTNEYTGNLVWNIKAPTHPNPRPGVFYIEHPTATSYAFNRQGYEDANAVCYWTGRDTGSAIQVEERGVFNLSDLTNQRIYALQAERSPLMYSTTEGNTTKLSSGLVDGVSANANDINQQFLILRTSETPEGQYYLYSIGAGKFVDANLNFVDYPEPVLSFEAYAGDNSIGYPWCVKIDGKYVVPGINGAAGNKLYHQETVNDDEGKRYRIINAGAYDASAVLAVINKVEHLVKSTADLSNNKVYTVTPKDNATTGVWDVKYDGENATMLAITKFTENAVDPTNLNQQFAFLTVNGEHYLYSYGAKKFVAKNENGQMLTDELSDACRVEFLNSTIASEQKFFPLVVKVGGSQLHSTPQYEDRGGIITNWNDTGSGGNAVAIVAVDGTVDLSEAIAKIEEYQAGVLKQGLHELITYASTVATIENLSDEAKAALNTAIVTAQGVYNNDAVEYLAVETAIANLNIAIDEAIKSVVTSRLFRLKNTASGLYMTIVTPEKPGGVKIMDKANESVNQVFSFVPTGEVGKYNVKSAEGYYMTAFDVWEYGAYKTDKEEGRVHHVEYLGNGEYTLKTLLGYAGSNDGAVTAESPLYSNHPADRVTVKWKLEALADDATPEVKPLMQTAESLLSKQGVGYPTSQSEVRTNLLNALLAMDAEKLNTAITTFKTSTDITLPEHGKAYRLAFVANDGDKTLYQIRSNGNSLSVSASETASTFYCIKYTNVDGNERYAFISEEGRYLAYRALTDNYRTHDGDTKLLQNDFTVAAMVGVTSYVTSRSEDRFGTVYMTVNNRLEGYKSNPGCLILKYSADNKPFDNSDIPFHNENFTSAIKVTEVVDYKPNDEVLKAASKILPLINGYNIIGENLGYYTYTFNESSGNVFTDFEKLVNNAENVIGSSDYSFIVNTPENGKFYRMKSPSSDNYMLSEVSDKLISGYYECLKMGTSMLSSVFYYGEAGTLLSYANGQYLPAAKQNSNWSCLAVESNPPVVTFGAGSKLGTLGFYLGDDSSRAYYSGRNTYVDAGGQFGTDGGYDWVIEEVTTLPVTVASIGYATLYAPVALQIPDGVNVYVGKIDEDCLILTSIDENVIPANTGVLIEADPNTYTFPIVENVNPIEPNAFTGSYAKSVKNPDKKVYTLQNGKNGVGFYLFKGYKNENDKEGTKTYINGFRSWVELPLSASAQGLRIRKEGTNVEKVELENQLFPVIYDLMGRRVEKMDKGIYIVNGKKILVK